MSTTVRRSTHLSRHLQFLREQRGLRPGQLAVALGASNSSKVGSLIRSFELGDHLSDHWLQAPVEELQPDPSDIRRCLRLDQEEGQRQLEQERLAKGFLSWTRRQRTWFDEGGLNPQRRAVTFEDRHTGAWMQVSGSQRQFLLGSTGELITRSLGLDQPA